VVAVATLSSAEIRVDEEEDELRTVTYMMFFSVQMRHAEMAGHVF
jgi:hypothetical protein